MPDKSPTVRHMSSIAETPRGLPQGLMPVVHSPAPWASAAVSPFAAITGGALGSMAGMPIGALIGAGRGNTAEGLGRGAIRGGATGAGGLGGMMLANALARSLGSGSLSNTTALANLIGLLGGGAAGWIGSGKVLGKPVGRGDKDKDEEKRSSLLSKHAKDSLPGGLADSKPPSSFPKRQMALGQSVEMEHTNKPSLAREIAADHLEEFDDYYTALAAMERGLETKHEKESTVNILDQLDKAAEDAAPCPGSKIRSKGKGRGLGKGKGKGPIGVPVEEKDKGPIGVPAEEKDAGAYSEALGFANPLNAYGPGVLGGGIAALMKPTRGVKEQAKHDVDGGIRQALLNVLVPGVGPYNAYKRLGMSIRGPEMQAARAKLVGTEEPIGEERIEQIIQAVMDRQGKKDEEEVVTKESNVLDQLDTVYKAAAAPATGGAAGAGAAATGRRVGFL